MDILTALNQQPVLLAVTLLLLGATVGSFLNVVIYRIRGRLRQAGMAPSLIGKEPQWTRLQQTQVAFVADSSSSRNAKTASDSVDG